MAAIAALIPPEERAARGAHGALRAPDAR
jgi:hypothetical protein